ncbi:hypothetical protein HMPREF9072_01571 [Capnocytophaga sp. oral taxon 324 str. F0483]|nr:hypothetical protein HMPREF9072_01571 [Capnocytophaga sp. oral taxon 324 str. F0483]
MLLLVPMRHNTLPKFLPVRLAPLAKLMVINRPSCYNLTPACVARTTFLPPHFH